MVGWAAMSRPPTHSATAARIGGAALALFSGGCSLLLDFSEPEPPSYPAEECGYGEPNDAPEEATPLTAEPVAAALCRRAAGPDFDFFSLTVSPGQSITHLTLRFTQDGPQGNLDLYLYDAAGVEVGKAASSDDDEVITCPGAPCISRLEPGAYVLEVRESIFSLSGNRYTLELQAQ